MDASKAVEAVSTAEVPEGDFGVDVSDRQDVVVLGVVDEAGTGAVFLVFSSFTRMLQLTTADGPGVEGTGCGGAAVHDAMHQLRRDLGG